MLFETCPRAYYLSYVAKDGDGVDAISNVFAQYGSFAHNLIDRWAKQELKPGELIDHYKQGYPDAVTLRFPASSPHMADDYYTAGYDYFADFESVYPGATVLASETKHVNELFGFDFSYITDAELALPDGRIALMDHKSASRKSFYGKQGREKFRQLYLYAALYQQRTGRFPDKLIFNLFREGVRIERDFDPKELGDTLGWAGETANDILYMTQNFAHKPNEWPRRRSVWYCRWLCDVSQDCE